MARYAQMQGTVCVNVALADQPTATARGWLGPIPTQVGPGWTTADNGQTWVTGTLPVPIEQANERTIRDLAEAGLAQLQAIIDTADPAAGTLTAAQLSTAVRSLSASVKTLARIDRRMIRLALARFDGTD